MITARQNAEFSTERNNNCYMQVKTDRDEWIEKADHYLSIAKQYESGQSRSIKRHGTTALIFNASRLHLECKAGWYQRAAEAYWICGDYYLDVAESYAFAAAVHARELRDAEKAAYLYILAAEAYEKLDGVGAECYYCKAISLFCKISNYEMAGLLQQQIAQNNETHKKYKAAIRAHEKASNYFLASKNEHQSNLSLSKVAYLSGWIGHYRKAALLYVSMADYYLKYNLKKHSAKKFFFRAGLLYVAIMMGGEEEEEEEESTNIYNQQQLMKMWNDYKTKDCQFDISCEHMFLHNLVIIIEKKDVDAFADHVYFFDEVYCLDAWCLKILDKIRNAMMKKCF